jgi:hypothetical protein
MSRKTPGRPVEEDLAPADQELFAAAWDAARSFHGDRITFYLPGMIRYGRLRGRYPAISLTGTRCDLQCEHCRGRLLEPMIHVSDPDRLLAAALRLRDAGALGLLLSGGADPHGRLPWEVYGAALRRISEDTSLFLSAHTGFPDTASCRLLKEAGVRQGLIDVMGDDETATRVYHLDGLHVARHAAEAIKKSGLQLVPHVVAGLNHGLVSAEHKALEMIARLDPDALVIVCLTPLEGTPMAGARHPAPKEVARLIAMARLLMPHVPISLGCERPRNRDGWTLERLALRAGVTRMAVWSDNVLDEAKRLGLTPRFQATCCSLEYDREVGGC